MRILWLSYYYLPHVGGGTWGTYHLSSCLSKRGHKVQLIVPNIKHKLSIPQESSISLEEKNPSSIHRTPSTRIPRILGPLLSSLFIFCAGLRLAKGADVIVSQHHPYHLLTSIAVFLGRILKIPVVLRADDVWEKERGVKNQGLINLFIKSVNSFNEYFIKYAKVFLVANSDSKEILVSRLRKNASICHIGLSYNGVNLSDFNDAPNKEQARKLLGIEPDEKVLLVVGRFSGEEYGIEVLLRAFPIILQKMPQSILILVGDKMTSNQQGLVNSLKISKNIRVYGPRSHEEIVKFIVAADLCIGPLMPTLASPLKVLEYMACGKPVVTGRKSISKDLNPNFNFLVVPPEPKSLAEAILKVLGDEDYGRRLGSNAKTFVKKFSWDKVAFDLERQILNILSDGRS